MTRPTTFDGYVSQIPPEPRAALESLRKLIRSIAPDTVETISYQMPTFKYRGRPLVGIAAFKNHCSLFPYSTGVMKMLKEDLEPFDTSGNGATIRFTADDPLPSELVEKIVRARMSEIDCRSR